MTQDNRDHIGRSHSGLVPGLIVAGIGVIFLLNNLRIVHAYEIWRFWPVILIAIGVLKLVDSPHPNEKTFGAIMLVAGAIFLARNLGWISWRIWELWPLILIAAGLTMLLNRTGLIGIDPNIRIRSRDGSKPDAIAIFGGFKRQIATDDFRGGHYVAIFGGGEIDVRRSQIQGDAAVVDVTAIFGGFELKVPANWVVVNEVIGIFGGTSDETLQPTPDMPGVKRLIVRGSTIFGGLGIKN
jgi:hypothetical protein